jgi:hypothetical protein
MKRVRFAGATRHLVTLFLAVSVLNFPALTAVASAPSRGILKANGIVRVDDLRASSGLTIFSGSRMVTSSQSAAVIELGKLSRLLLSEQTELRLDFSETSISASIGTGKVRAFLPIAKPLTLITPAGVLVTDSSAVAILTVQVSNEATIVSVEQGRAELRSGKEIRTVSPGETFTAAGDCAAMPAPQQNLNTKAKVGLVAGIGAGLAILLFAITGDEDEEVDSFGGCVIVPSGSNDNPGQCS